MKFIILMLSLSFLSFADTEESSFLPRGEKLPKKSFFEVIKIIREEFQHLAETQGRKFQILADYEEDWAQAFARRWETDQIIVYGGASALEGGNEDSFALLLCHETGHLYGGAPFSDDHNSLSVEGQADYWSASCFRKVERRLPFREGDRLKNAALILAAFYAENRNVPKPALETPDRSVVPLTLKTHPEPQCRLDSILAGDSLGPRPRCWYAP